MRKVKRIVVVATAMVLILLLAGLNPAGTSARQPRQMERDFFYSSGQEVPVQIALDQIGVVVREGEPSEEVAAFARQYGLELLQAHPGDLYILGLSETAERGTLVELARELRLDSFLRDAGLVVIADSDPEAPMILTDQFIAQFHSEVTPDEVMALNQEFGVEIVREDRYAKNQYLLQVMGNNPADALSMANGYHEQELVIFSHPNFWLLYQPMETVPNDPLFGNQWHHRNLGQSGGLADADADTSWAWDITTGSDNVLIAIMDDSMQLNHPDLVPNLFTNPGEVPGNGVDDDGNGYVDDVNGWDFRGNDNNPNPALATDNHGTAVAGVAAARGNNALGVSGACQDCEILPVRLCCTATTQAFADAFGYSSAMGADIINNSWGHTSPSGVVPTAIRNAIDNAAAAGSIIFFAAGNGNSSGWCGNSYPSLASVIAVSSSTNEDRKVTEAAFGNCIDIMAPSHRGYFAPYNGTLNVTTTDRTGATGYNNANPPPLACAIAEPGNQDYTHCFGGTSSASPLAAGIAGLIRSVNSTMSRVQVQRLIQDTADKIVPGTALYADDTGFSTPATGIATHSWGRINAFEAVRIAAPVAQEGKGGVDIFVRDNNLDWGNTTGYLGQQPSSTLFESPRGFIPFWRSEDIKVDAPPYQPAPANSAAFEALTNETPREGDVNRVYVRVRNRGPVTASSVTVKLHWAYAGTGLPALPADFWTAFPADSTNTMQIHPIGTQTLTNLAYSGSSIAGTVADAAQIATFNWTGPAVNPALPNHYCLFLVIDSPQDPIDPVSETHFNIDSVTPNDNNVTHRNMEVEDTREGTSFERRFFIRNPRAEAIIARLRLVAPEALRQGWQFSLDGAVFDESLSLDPGEERLVTLKVVVSEPGQEADVNVIQERLDTPVEPEVMGGVTYRFVSLPAAGVNTFLPVISR